MRGITYDQVEAVARDILREGRSPSVQAVRTELGTGSATTINQHLREFWKRLGESMQVPALEGMPEGLIEPLRTLWAEAREAALERLEEERAAARDEVQATSARAEQLRLECATLQQQVEGQEAQMEQGRAERRTLIEAQEVLEVSFHEKDRELTAAQAESERISQAHAADRRRFAQQLRHARQTVKDLERRLRDSEAGHAEALKAERERGDKQEAHWLTELERTRREASTRVAELAKTNKRLEGQLRYAQEALKAAQSDARAGERRWEAQLKTVRGEAAGRLGEMQSALAKVRDEAANLRTELSTQATAAEELRKQTQKLAAECECLSRENEALNLAVQRFEEKQQNSGD